MTSKSREIQADFWKTHPYLLIADIIQKLNEIPMDEFSKIGLAHDLKNWNFEKIGGVFQENKLPPKIGVEISVCFILGWKSSNEFSWL